MTKEGTSLCRSYPRRIPQPSLNKSTQVTAAVMKLPRESDLKPTVLSKMKPHEIFASSAQQGKTVQIQSTNLKCSLRDYQNDVQGDYPFRPCRCFLPAWVIPTCTRLSPGASSILLWTPTCVADHSTASNLKIDYHVT